MKRNDYQPGDAGDAKVLRGDGRGTLVFVRELKHAPEKVWGMLTDPAQLREWAPFDPDRDLEKTGSATLFMAGAPEPSPFESTVRRADRPRVLEYTWGGDVLRWELQPIVSSGTRLTLRHTTDHAEWLPKVAAGWHICIDVAERFLDGAPVGRIVGDDARKHGWERLNDAYARSFQISNTGWPENPTGAPGST